MGRDNDRTAVNPRVVVGSLPTDQASISARTNLRRAIDDLLTQIAMENGSPLLLEWLQWAGESIAAADVVEALRVAQAALGGDDRTPAREGAYGTTANPPEPLRVGPWVLGGSARRRLFRSVLDGTIVPGFVRRQAHAAGLSPGVPADATSLATAALRQILEALHTFESSPLGASGPDEFAGISSMIATQDEALRHAALTLDRYCVGAALAEAVARPWAQGFCTRPVDPVWTVEATHAVDASVANARQVLRLYAALEWCRIWLASDDGTRSDESRAVDLRRLLGGARLSAGPTNGARDQSPDQLMLASIATPSAATARLLAGMLVDVSGCDDLVLPLTVDIAIDATAAQPRWVASARMPFGHVPAPSGRIEFCALSELTDRVGSCYNAATMSADTALVTPYRDLASVSIAADGTIQRLETWPYPITGELPWGASGGGFAWDRIDEGKVYRLLFRPGRGEPVQVVSPPFAPSFAVAHEPYPLWAALDGGVWRWQPGLEVEQLAESPPIKAMRREGDGWVLEPIGTRPASPPDRGGVSVSWFWDGASRSVSERTIGPLGPCYFESRTPSGWLAQCFPYADVVLLSSNNGRRWLLHFYRPQFAVWAGEALVVATGDRGEVVHLRDVLRRL